MNKTSCLEQAIEITKEFAKSDVPKNDTSIINVLENVYASLVKLSEELDD